MPQLLPLSFWGLSVAWSMCFHLLKGLAVKAWPCGQGLQFPINASAWVARRSHLRNPSASLLTLLSSITVIDTKGDFSKNLHLPTSCVYVEQGTDVSLLGPLKLLHTQRTTENSNPWGSFSGLKAEHPPGAENSAP